MQSFQCPGPSMAEVPKEPSLWCRHHGYLGCHTFPCGGDVEGLCCLLRQPTDYSWHTWEQCLLTGVIPSHRTVEANMALDHIFCGVQGSWKG
jgi:hypothetical protein